MTEDYVAIPRDNVRNDNSMRYANEGLATSLRNAGIDLRPLPRVETVTVKALQSVITASHEPMIFPGLVGGWPARNAWTPERLIRIHGRQLITTLMDLPSAGVLFPQEQRYYERTLMFGEFIRRMLTATSDAPCYLAYTPVKGLFPAEDYDVESLIPPDQYANDTRVWIGSAGTRSMLHSDPRDNLFCQIYGEKSVVLLPGEQSDAAYPFPDNIANSRIDLANLDVKKFPRLWKASLYAGILRPGDALYIPRGCWHDLRSHTPSISLNHWFGPRLTFRDYVKVLLSLGPSYWAVTVRDFIVQGILQKREGTFFFFSPPSTGKRLYDLLKQMIERS